MKNKRLIIVLSMMPFILIWLLLFSSCARSSNYNFGIKISEQQQYFSNHYGHRNPKRYGGAGKYINVYRDKLEIDLKHNKQYPIAIEFLVDAIDYDIRCYPAVDSEKYLLTTMEIGFTNQVQVTQKITVDGNLLEHVAKYICVYEKEKNYYVPRSVADAEYLTNGKKYRVVHAYKFPKGIYRKELKKFWFKSGNIEVDIKVKDKEELNEKLDFKLHWYRRSTAWERFCNIT